MFLSARMSRFTGTSFRDLRTRAAKSIVRSKTAVSDSSYGWDDDPALDIGGEGVSVLGGGVPGESVFVRSWPLETEWRRQVMAIGDIVRSTARQRQRSAEKARCRQVIGNVMCGVPRERSDSNLSKEVSTEGENGHEV